MRLYGSLSFCDGYIFLKRIAPKTGALNVTLSLVRLVAKLQANAFSDLGINQGQSNISKCVNPEVI